MIGDLMSQTDFVQSLRKTMPDLSWQLRYKLLTVYVDSLPLSEKVNILSNAVSLLQEAQFVHLFGALTQCYASFDELKNAEASKSDDKVLEDAEATSKMESEALDAGFHDTEGEIVQKGEALSQQLRNYLSVLDVIARVFTPANESLPYPPPFQPLIRSAIEDSDLQTLLSCLLRVLSILSTQVASSCVQSESIRASLLAAVDDAIAAVLPATHTHLPALWSAVLPSLAPSAPSEVLEAASKLLWVWAQCTVNHPSYADSMNPLGFPEQTAPLLAALESREPAVLVQLVNTIACLLAPVQIAPQNEAMLAEICGKVVHVLDGAENAQNAEILGCVLDFMMTMCGERDGCDVDSERPSSCRSSGSWS